MRDKQLLMKCLKFAKNLNIILESVSDQVLAFVYKKLPEIEKETIENSYKQMINNEQVKQLSYPYQSYILYKYLKEKTDINDLYKICMNHKTLFERYRDRLKPEEQSIISDHLLKLPSLEFKDELNQLANMIEREREAKGKKKTAVFEREEEKPYFEDENVIIRDIKSREDAIKYGCDTRWCIAAPNNSMFSAYTLGGSQFVFYENKKTNNKFAFVNVHRSNKELLRLCNIGGSQHNLQNDIIVFDKDDKTYVPERIFNQDEFLSNYYNIIKSLLDKKSNGGITEEFLNLYRSQKLVQSVQTRKYFSFSPLTAYAYFYLIDKKTPSPVTYSGVLHSPDLRNQYTNLIPHSFMFEKNNDYLFNKNSLLINRLLEAENNNENRILEIIEKYKSFDNETLRIIIRKKYNKIVKFLILNDKNNLSSELYKYAAVYKNNEIFEFLIEVGCQFDKSIENFFLMIDNDIDSEYFKKLIESGYPVDNDTFLLTIKQLRTSIVEFLLSTKKEKITIDNNTYKFLYNKADRFFVNYQDEDEEELSREVDKITELLIQFKIPDSPKITVDQAIINGYHKSAEVLIDKNCKIDASTINLALFRDLRKIVNKLLLRNCPLNIQTMSEALQLPKNPQNFELIESLLKKKCPMDHNTLILALDKKIDYNTISKLVEHGCPISYEAILHATKLGIDAKILKLLEIYYKRKKTVSFANAMRNLDKKSVQTKREENEENFEDIMDTKKKYKLNENKNWEELWDNFIIRKEW